MFKLLNSLNWILHNFGTPCIYIHSISIHLLHRVKGILRYKKIMIALTCGKKLNLEASNKSSLVPPYVLLILISVFERMVLEYCKEWNNTNSGLWGGTLWLNKWTQQSYRVEQMGHRVVPNRVVRIRSVVVNSLKARKQKDS